MAISGCIILGVSIYLKVSKGANKITNMALPGIDLLIAIGAIIMVLGFLGCCGALRENRCLLLLFFIGLLLIFILLLAAGILGALEEGKSDWVKQELGKMLPLSKQPVDVQTDLQFLEKEAKCCGLLNGPQDWEGQIPQSCNCTDTSASCDTVSGRRVYNTPCVTAVILYIKSHLTIALGIAFGFAILLLFGMGFAMTLYCQIGKKNVGAA
ncbi:Tetraspanin-8-like [Scleropages formosus]|uniref:Tetraspanin n=1 Tax=Scleropages formosus TaxID=113540 RepID=A0A0P7TRN4_SCLFO|nr:Tetraspanin-8-like [Scleropages formosus]